MERRLREKIGLEEKQVRHVKFGHLLDSSVEMSGRQLMVVIGRALDHKENSGDFQCPWSLQE